MIVYVLIQTDLGDECIINRIVIGVYDSRAKAEAALAGHRMSHHCKVEA